MKLLLAWLFFIMWLPGKAQDSTLVNSGTDSLLAELVDTASQPLLPERMVFTQRAFWGQNGLLRLTGLAPLTKESRQHELKIRRTMLVSHQIIGFVTLAGFVAQGIVGSQLYNAKGVDYTRLRSIHTGIATFINVAYGSTALLSLTAPPPTIGRRQRGLNSIKLHKYLALVHLTGMIATNILAKQLPQYPEVKPYHRAAAYTTFASFAMAIAVIKF